jgi:hypothetical protein
VLAAAGVVTGFQAMPMLAIIHGIKVTMYYADRRRRTFTLSPGRMKSWSASLI